MSKFLGVRIPEALYNALGETAQAGFVTKTDIVKTALERYLNYEIDEDWQIAAWNLFDIDAHKLKYALSYSSSAAEFFSLVSKWAKGMKLRVKEARVETVIEVATANRTFIVKEGNEKPKIAIISSITKQIDSALIELFDEDEEEK